MHSQVTQPWYMDDAGAGGTFADLQVPIRYVVVRVPAWEYFPDPTNIILVVLPSNPLKTEAYFRGMVLRVVSISRYLGGFIIEPEVENDWIADKFQGWADSVGLMTKLELQLPQTSCSGLHNDLQQAWYFVQRIIPGIREAFSPVKEYLQRSFLPDLFHGDTVKIAVQGVTSLPVKQAGLALPKPSISSLKNWTASCIIIGHLVAALQDRT